MERVQLTKTKIPTSKKCYCEKHGDFQANIYSVTINGTVRETPAVCPKCMAEREKESIKINLGKYRNGIGDIDKVVEKQLIAAGVGRRFAGIRFKDLLVVNGKQKLILQRCERYCNKYRELFKLGTSLILTGRPGTGKTAIASAMLQKILRREQIRKFKKEIFSGAQCKKYDGVAYINATELMAEIKATYRRDATDTEKKILEKYITKKLIVIDEVGAQIGSVHELVLMFRIINARYENARPTVLISNLNEKDLEAFLGERTVDRFRENYGAVLVFDWESYRRKAWGTNGK